MFQIWLNRPCGCSAAARVGAGALLLLLGPGCLAYVQHRQLTEDQDNAPESVGIRYYESSLYLLVYSNGKGGLETKILELPDPSKLTMATPTSRLAKLDTTLDFQNGYLGNAIHEGDSTVIPTAVAEAVKAVLPSLVGVLEAPEGGPEEVFQAPAPYLFKIHVENGIVRFVGAKGDKDVHITLAEAKE